ncbi:MAG: hypothetical protein HYZ44_10235 [Bacteroidetes bacterium]|nr:hypothetical protein [Bacteroidota bacterium]
MKQVEGKFEVIDSFAIRRRNEFYLIGRINEGIAKEAWFVNIPLNGSLTFTLRISKIEEVEISREENKYTLIIISPENDETLDLLLGLNIGNESFDITIDGED